MMGHMQWTFTGEVIEWRGPAPYLFVAMTPDDSEDLKEAASGLTYWGQVPVHVTIGSTEFTTALFPRDGRYLVPVKAAVQRAEAIGEGAVVEVALRLNAARRKLPSTAVSRPRRLATRSRSVRRQRRSAPFRPPGLMMSPAVVSEQADPAPKAPTSVDHVACEGHRFIR
jgi:hypothetical protein